MHMLFLGHVKSNLDMVSKWLGKFDCLATFGKQVNQYLLAIRSLRCTKYFSAQPLSTSSWGTGVWVSENYLLASRIWRFLLCVPSLRHQRLASKPDFLPERKVIERFIVMMNLCLSRIMANRQEIVDLHDLVLIYMDAMVDVDDILLAAEKQKKLPNFVKSNSLGILSCALTHHEMGPALLHWEGGWEGERKIQKMKPLLHIKRSNADWQNLTLRKLYQHDTIQWILAQDPSYADKILSRKRESESMVRVFRNRQEALQAINDCEILSAILLNDDNIYLAFRPIGEVSRGNTRSMVKLLPLCFDDSQGTLSDTLCWTAPIGVSQDGNEHLFESLAHINQEALSEVFLLLPSMSEVSNTFVNSYWCVGNNWRERTESGQFQYPILSNTLF